MFYMITKYEWLALNIIYIGGDWIYNMMTKAKNKVIIEKVDHVTKDGIFCVFQII